MEPGCIDVDHSYHAQCMDLPLDYVLLVNRWKSKNVGNAKDAFNNKFPTGWKVIENLPSTVPQKVGLPYFLAAHMHNTVTSV